MSAALDSRYDTDGWRVVDWDITMAVESSGCYYHKYNHVPAPTKTWSNTRIQSNLSTVFRRLFLAEWTRWNYTWMSITFQMLYFYKTCRIFPQRDTIILTGSNLYSYLCGEKTWKPRLRWMRFGVTGGDGGWFSARLASKFVRVQCILKMTPGVINCTPECSQISDRWEPWVKLCLATLAWHSG